MTIRPLAFALLAACSAQAQANIDIQFDYSYDTNNFFNATSKATLEAAAAAFESRFADSFTAISSSVGNQYNTTFFNPSDPFSDLTLNNQSFAADVLRIYVGGASLGAGNLGIGGPGGFGCSGFGGFCSAAESRGQGVVSGSGATDFASWGGAISFNTASTWHFGTTTSGLGGGAADFYSVAVHELAHVLGFGTADSFYARLIGSNFVGTDAGIVALHGDQGHWAEGTPSLVNGVAQEAAMDPTIFLGDRKYFTDLDYAAMQDIGWQVTAVPEAGTWAMLLAGLGLVGFSARRRMA
ncbi:MAG: PEP-CTERM sorting domain-containing protein [Burkholderiaceae bacterium]|nr:PEP-CTERM sorting domain-containing protein [Burkholderiaceae bacterium]